MCFPVNQLQLPKLDFNNWVEIRITDSENIYKNKSWRETFSIMFFTDKTDRIAKLLWDLKSSNEQLLVKIKTHRFKKEYSTELIENKNVLATKLDELKIKRYSFAVLYVWQENLEKIAFITGGEMLYLFIKREHMSDIENLVSMWAEKSNFNKYELGQEEDE